MACNTCDKYVDEEHDRNKNTSLKTSTPHETAIFPRQPQTYSLNSSVDASPSFLVNAGIATSTA
jgi:hypothetical protein